MHSYQSEHEFRNAVRQKSYNRNLMTTFRNRVGDPKYLMNMDDRAVRLNCNTNRKVHPSGQKTVAANIEDDTPSSIIV